MKGEPGHRASDYGRREVEAARRVIAEIADLLRTFGDATVLVGGWVPELSFPGAEPAHVGSLDVDLLLNPDQLPPALAKELAKALENHGYRRTEPPFKLVKAIRVDDGEPVAVELDLLIPTGAPMWRTGRGAAGLRPAPAAGAKLALRSTQRALLEIRAPGGLLTHVEVTIPTAGAWLVMKAHALAGREKEKDAYDIVFCLRNLPQGAAVVAGELSPFLHLPDVRRALEILRERFRSPEDSGPRAFSRFESPADADERAFLARDAYERVQTLLRALGFAENEGE
jgi:hypothetical protein